MLAVNFKGVNDDQSIDINDLFPGGGKSDTKFTPAGTAADADKVQVWDATSAEYSTYYLYKKAKGTSEANYWWVDETATVAEKKFKNGDAFWFYKRGTTDVTATTSGEVVLDSVKTVAIKSGWNMIGSYFPAGWKLNDDYYTPTYWQNSGATYAGTSADADKIQVWNATTKEYSTYYLYKKAKGTSDANYTWVDETATTVTTDVLSAGQGAWYYHRGTGFNLEIKKQF